MLAAVIFTSGYLTNGLSCFGKSATTLSPAKSDEPFAIPRLPWTCNFADVGGAPTPVAASKKRRFDMPQ
jgi:hypothetical protein